MVLLIKKGNGSIVPTVPAIAVDAIKIRRIRRATSLPKLLRPERQVENVRPCPGGSLVTLPVNGQID